MAKALRSAPKTRTEGTVRSPRWTVTVEGMGRIRKASIKMAPLVVLVGKNNTGKSQVASLLWALMNAEELILRRRASPTLKAPPWFRALYEERTAENPRILYALSSSNLDEMEENINSVIRDRKDEIVRNIFSHSDASVRKIEIELCREELSPVITALYMDGSPRGYFDWKNDNDRLHLETSIAANSEGNFSFVEFFYGWFLDGVLSGGASPGVNRRAVYIPAARTGLMLAFKMIVSRLLDGLHSSPSEDRFGAFPLPVVRFLQSLNDLRGRNTRFSKMATILERDVLHGAVKKSTGVNADFSYAPEGSDISLPLHVTSSMVTEIAPFLLLLRSGDLSWGVVFEEPEAHLHLSAQRHIAKCIARLVNAGVPVILTTHSDTFVQQINLSLEIGAHEKPQAMAKAFGYAKDEILAADQVRAYEFNDDGASTKVVELGRSGAAFIVPSINDTIEKLAREVIAIEKAGS